MSLQAKDLMTLKPAFCSSDAKLDEVAELMVDRDCGEIPVVDDAVNRKVIGVVTDRDIVCRLLAKHQNPLEHTVEDCMTSPAMTVRGDADIESCYQLMKERQIRRLPIVDGDGKLLGMLSQADIARAAQDDAAKVLREVSLRKGQVGGQQRVS